MYNRYYSYYIKDDLNAEVMKKIEVIDEDINEIKSMADALKVIDKFKNEYIDMLKDVIKFVAQEITAKEKDKFDKKTYKVNQDRDYAVNKTLMLIAENRILKEELFKCWKETNKDIMKNLLKEFGEQ
jgi:hypothetical protein